MKRKLLRLLALVMAVSLVAAACGSDDPVEAVSEAVQEAVSDDEPEEAMEDDEPEEAMEDDEPEEAASGDAFVIDTSACPDRAFETIEDTIVIGTSLPLSGGPAAVFAPYIDGLQAYVDFYNDTEGGVNGQPLELLKRDDQYSADLTSQIVSELVFDEDVDILAGVLGTAGNLAVRDLLNDECVPQLMAGTGDLGFATANDFPWTSAAVIGYGIESRAWAQYVADEVDGNRVALLTADNEAGQGYVDIFIESAEELGLEIVAQETIGITDTGAPTAQMTNIVAADPDAMLAVPIGAQCAAFMTELGNQQAANPDFDPVVYNTATCALLGPLFYSLVENGGNDGVISATNKLDVNDPALADNPAVATYRDALAATGSEADPGGIAILGWQAMELTVHALEAAAASPEGLTRASIGNAVRNIDFAPSLALDGIRFQMNANDGWPAEALRLQSWDAASGSWMPFGEILDFEGSVGAG